MIGLYERIYEICRHNPARIAFSMENEEIAYGEMIEKAKMYAGFMKMQDVKTGEIVCIISKRNCELIYCIIAALQVGCAYVVIHPDYPLDFIERIIESCNSKLVFNFSELKIEGTYGAIEKSELKYEEFEKISRDSLVYLSFTSGSKGIPKAVMVSLENITTYLEAYIDLFQVNENDITIQQSPCYYDGMAEEIFSMFLVGGKTILVHDEYLRSPRRLRKVIEENGITIVATTPAILRELNKLPPMENVRAFISSAESLYLSDFSNIIKYTNVYNMYGPTETTICATFYKCKEHDEYNIPLGKPINNYKIGIVDENMNFLEEENKGEILIGGLGVTKGYLNDANMTKQKFVFIDNEKWYRTGDVGYYKNGELIFGGRFDRQIKVRGNKIELDRIEEVICQKDGIFDAVIYPYSINKNVYLIAFYVGSCSTDECRKYVKHKLPDFMCPFMYISLKEIPLLETGKKDLMCLKNMVENLAIKKFLELENNEKEFMKVIVDSVDIIPNNIKLDMTTTIEEMRMDSISFIQIIVNLEEFYDIEFEDDCLDYNNYSTLKDLYNKVIILKNRKSEEMNDV